MKTFETEIEYLKEWNMRLYSRKQGNKPYKPFLAFALLLSIKLDSQKEKYSLDEITEIFTDLYLNFKWKHGILLENQTSKVIKKLDKVYKAHKNTNMLTINNVNDALKNDVIKDVSNTIKKGPLIFLPADLQELREMSCITYYADRDAALKTGSDMITNLYNVVWEDKKLFVEFTEKNKQTIIENFSLFFDLALLSFIRYLKVNNDFEKVVLAVDDVFNINSRQRLSLKNIRDILKEFEMDVNDKVTCFFDGKTLSDDEDIHVDHFVPFSKGGGCQIGNLTLTHKTKNMSMGNKLTDKTQARMTKLNERNEKLLDWLKDKEEYEYHYNELLLFQKNHTIENYVKLHLGK